MYILEEPYVLTLTQITLKPNINKNMLPKTKQKHVELNGVTLTQITTKQNINKNMLPETKQKHVELNVTCII